MLLANNHVMDYGEDGCMATVNAFGKDMTVGAGTAEEAYRLKVFTVKGKRIGFLSLVQCEFGVVSSPDCKGEIGAAWINALEIPDIVREARAALDYLIICPHAGVEHILAPLPEWQRVYRRFIDWGADAVVGTHPHTPQGWEEYKGKPIFYSLGNFYFNISGTDSNPWERKSQLVEMTFGERGLSYQVHHVEYDDKRISIDHGPEIVEHTDYINRLLRNEGAHRKYINRVCEELYPNYRYGILRGVSGTSLQAGMKKFMKLAAGMVMGSMDEAYLLNSVRCESHRWVIERYLKNHANLK